MRRVLVFLAWCVAFDLAYTQLPLFDGNSATYLLHGAACAGRGSLRDDWLARTTDPFPVVSALSCGVFRLGSGASDIVFHALHAFLLGVYLAALVAVARAVFRERWTPGKSVLLASALVVVHSVLFRHAVELVTGGDWGWYLQSGVAMQYLVGFVFQPSLFGVLLVASVAAFLHRRDALAVVLGAAAVLAHASYLLTFLGLVIAYALVRLREGTRPRAARILVVTALSLAPALLLMARFAPADATTFAEAQRLLVDVRIPHHALVERWATPRIGIALALVVAALVVLRKRSPLLLVLGVLAAWTTALTVVVAVTHARPLALLFPWRASTLLVPLATMVLLAAAIARLPAHLSRRSRARVAVALLLVGASSVFGLLRMRRDFAEYRDEDPALPMMRFVAATASPTDEYVIPTRLSRFRLETGARTFIDYKSHPYRSDEVVAWYARVERAKAFEDARGEAACALAADLTSREGATMFVTPTPSTPSCAGWETAYRDASYTVSRAPPVTSIRPFQTLLNPSPRRPPRRPDRHHTRTRASGARYSGSPGFTSNAAYQASKLRTVSAR